MTSLFVDTSYNNIHLVLADDDTVVASKKIKDIIKISDVFNGEVENLLKENKLSLKDIEKLYVTKGPGSFTGVRVAVTFAKTLKIINPELKLFAISTLLYQAGTESAISYIDAKGGNTYFAIYNDGQEIIADQILDQAIAVAIANDFDDYLPFYDLSEFDFVNNFMKLRSYFTEIKNVEEFEPVYIKKFI